MEPSGKHQSTASVRHHLPGHSVYRPFVSVGVCQASSPGACSRFTLHDKVRPLHGAKEMITRILRYCVASHDRVCRLVGRPGRRTRRARPGQAGPPSRARRLALHGRGPGGAPPGCAHGRAGRGWQLPDAFEAVDGGPDSLFVAPGGRRGRGGLGPVHWRADSLPQGFVD